MPPVEVAIVGLGRWARVLARAVEDSTKIRIVAAYSRSDEKRAAFARDTGIPAAPDLASLLREARIEGVIVTAPNEEHLPLAREAASAGKHVYVEKPAANTLEDALALGALEPRHGVTVTVGHAARLLGGVRAIRSMIDRGELGRVAMIEANYSNKRALELTPDEWRWYRDRTPGGPLSQLGTHQIDVLHYLGGEIAEVSAMASKLSPAGAEVDDQSMTLLRFADGKLGYVGSSWTSPGVFSVRVLGSKALACFEMDLTRWATPQLAHEGASLYVQRIADGYGKREPLEVPRGDIFREELEMFAASCATGKPNELSAENGSVTVGVMCAALRSVEHHGRAVRLADLFGEAQRNASASTDSST